MTSRYRDTEVAEHRWQLATDDGSPSEQSGQTMIGAKRPVSRALPTHLEATYCVVKKDGLEEMKKE